MIADQYIEALKKKYSSDKKILVAMSGGVDSSVTALLLNRAGFKIVGVTLQLYRSAIINKSKTCCSGKDIKDAQNVACTEGFDHYVLDYTSYFKEKVIDDFVDSYQKGSTPIPCGRCNQYIKFGYLLDFCKKIGFDLLVTGHYVIKKGICLYKSPDLLKDQSYFLALTTKEQLKYIDFPLSFLKKTEVRLIAEEFGLKVANKQESMDICFIPDGNYKRFLKQIRPEMFKKGLILNKKGVVLGEHNGLVNYTIGQRKGLNLSNGPWYVVKLNVEDNSVIVGKKSDFIFNKCKIQEVSLLVDSSYFDKSVEIKVRSASEIYLGYVNLNLNIIEFLDNNIVLCKGQICAFYSDNLLLGGAIISDII